MKNNKCKNNKHAWKVYPIYQGVGSYRHRVGSNFICKNCGIEQKTKEDKVWDRWSAFVGEFR